MADWPTVERVAQVLDIENVADWEDDLSEKVEAAIARVKLDVGNWNEYDDVPDDALAQAAIQMAVLFAQRPSAPAGELAQDPTYQRLLFGHRRTFGFA